MSILIVLDGHLLLLLFLMTSSCSIDDSNLGDLKFESVSRVIITQASIALNQSKGVGLENSITRGSFPLRDLHDHVG